MTASTPAVATDDAGEGSFSHVLNRDLYKQRDKIVGTCVCVCVYEIADIK